MKKVESKINLHNNGCENLNAYIIRNVIICIVLCADFSIIIIILSGVRLSPLGTAATTGLLYQLQMMMVIVEQLVE
jgi:hypothetical protein